MESMSYLGWIEIWMNFQHLNSELMARRSEMFGKLELYSAWLGSEDVPQYSIIFNPKEKIHNQRVN